MAQQSKCLTVHCNNHCANVSQLYSNVRWDEDLQLYIGYVRLDNSTNHNYNRRRTGRTTSPDFVNWTEAVEVFAGHHLYEVYTVEPWRQSTWPAGLYLAMASFYATPTSTGHVYNELLQSEECDMLLVAQINFAW